MTITGCDGFIRSCLALDEEQGAQTSTDRILRWLRAQSASTPMIVRRIELAAMDAWHWTSAGRRALAHDTGRFFRVEGIRVEPRGRPQWDQPILVQDEVGLLGLLTASFNGVRHFLIQAKWEPGSRAPQLSPTVQATHSNYSRAHGGRSQSYLEYFFSGQERVFYDHVMGEYGRYFFAKRNRNVVVEVDPYLEVEPGYLWVTLGQIKAMIAMHEVIHTDTLSIIGCLAPGPGEASWPAGSEQQVRSFQELSGLPDLLRWLEALDSEQRLETEPCGVDELSGWVVAADGIRPVRDTPNEFAVIPVSVEAHRREVVRWTQPLIARDRAVICGLLCSNEGGVLRFRVQAMTEPGHPDSAHVAPTVMGYHDDPNALGPWLALVDEGRVLLDTWLTDEGGRFLHCCFRAMIVETSARVAEKLLPSHRWATLGELIELGRIRRSLIELRSLLAAVRFV